VDYSNAVSLPDEFVRIIKEIEAEIEAPVWMFIQADPNSQFSNISTQLCKKIIESGQIEANKPVALLLESGGGSPEAAYHIGDVWTWTAIDADTKLVPCWHVGNRLATAA
jgi:hypothetical protein